jgi:mono/diheme cytochrome c family protein
MRLVLAVVGNDVHRCRTAVWCIAGFVLPAIILSAQAQEPRRDPNSGESLYRAYCASCHGTLGRGDGPAASTLMATLPDLSTIARRHNSVFPRDEITRIIDGRAPLPGHQRGEMPVWGTILNRMEARDERAVQARVNALVSHLETLQGPAK